MGPDTRTLAYWGERISLDEAQRIRRDWRVVVPPELTQQPTAFRDWLAEYTRTQNQEAAQ